MSTRHMTQLPFFGLPMSPVALPFGSLPRAASCSTPVSSPARRVGVGSCYGECYRFDPGLLHSHHARSSVGALVSVVLHDLVQADGPR